MTSPIKTAAKISSKTMSQTQDKVNLEKYIKYFTFKFVQVVVQARCGEKLDCRIDPKKSQWFNLAIGDVNEITQETSKAFGNKMPCFNGQTVNVELSTLNHGIDGSFKIGIEVWTLSLNEDLSCPDIVHGVYNKLGTLLKSMLCISRLLPGYKTSLNEQGSESFIICYNVYLCEPDLSVLDTNYKTINVGKVGTPLGTLNLTVHYRTSLMEAPQKHAYFLERIESVSSSENNDSIIPKGSQENLEKMKPLDSNTVNSSSCSSSNSDALDNSDLQIDIFNCENLDELFFKNRKVGAFVTPFTAKETDIVKEDYFCIPELPFINLLSDHLKNWSENDQKLNCDTNNYNNKLLSNSNRISPNKVDIPSDKDVTLLNEYEMNSENSLKNGEANVQDNSTPTDEDDFVHVILKTPFAKPQKNELADFIHDCRMAPTLKSFSEDEVTLLDQVDILNNCFAEFESNLEKYDSFVKSLCKENEESD
ncbi:Autophagy-related protein 13 [Nymphon striatum]|nr:Autophagy-related protein 13 [Nymphon striatum]